MTKYRALLSIEFILSQVIKKLDDEEIKNFTGKSISHYRKCSDPEDKDHTLHLKDAIQLDVLMQKKMLGTPFLDLINSNLSQEFKKINDYVNVKNILINIGGRIGNLMDVTQEAIKPAGHKGEIISKKEKQEIFQAILEVEEKISRLKLSVKEK